MVRVLGTCGLQLLFLTVCSIYGSLEGYVGPGLSSDWQSILAFVVFAFRIVLARVLTAFTASSLVRIVFNSTWLLVHEYCVMTR